MSKKQTYKEFKKWVDDQVNMAEDMGLDENTEVLPDMVEQNAQAWVQLQEMLVLTFSTNSDERITFEYSAFHLTDTAKALIEILEIETDDEFFQGLADNFKERLAGIDVIVEVYSVEELG
ncbi:TPA: hypothetical protein ACHVI3_001820 [Streptococcus suis]